MYQAPNIELLVASVRSPENEECEVVAVWATFYLLLETPEHSPVSPATVLADFKTHSFQGPPDCVCLQTLAPEALFLSYWGALAPSAPPFSDLRERFLSARIQGGHSSMGGLTVVLIL